MKRSIRDEPDSYNTISFPLLLIAVKEKNQPAFKLF